MFRFVRSAARQAMLWALLLVVSLLPLLLVALPFLPWAWPYVTETGTTRTTVSASELLGSASWPTPYLMEAATRRPIEELMPARDRLLAAWDSLLLFLWGQYLLAAAIFVLAPCCGAAVWRRFADHGLGRDGRNRAQRIVSALQSRAPALLRPDETVRDQILLVRGDVHSSPDRALSTCLLGAATGWCGLILVSSLAVLLPLEGDLAFLRLTPHLCAFGAVAVLGRFSLPSRRARLFLDALNLIILYALSQVAGSGCPRIFVYALWLMTALVVWDVLRAAGAERSRILLATSQRILQCTVRGLRRRFEVVDSVQGVRRVTARPAWLGYQLQIEGEDGRRIECTVQGRPSLERYCATLRAADPDGPARLEWLPGLPFCRSVGQALAFAGAAVVLLILPATHAAAHLVHRICVASAHPIASISAWKEGRYEASVGHCRLALAALPGEPVALVVMAMALCAQERYDEALRVVDQLPRLVAGQCGELAREVRQMAAHDAPLVEGWRARVAAEPGLPPEVLRHCYLADLWWSGRIGSSRLNGKVRALQHADEALKLAPAYVPAQELRGRITGIPSLEPPFAQVLAALRAKATGQAPPPGVTVPPIERLGAVILARGTTELWPQTAPMRQIGVTDPAVLRVALLQKDSIPHLELTAVSSGAAEVIVVATLTEQWYSIAVRVTDEPVTTRTPWPAGWSEKDRRAGCARLLAEAEELDTRREKPPEVRGRILSRVMQAARMSAGPDGNPTLPEAWDRRVREIRPILQSQEETSFRQYQTARKLKDYPQMRTCVRTLLGLFPVADDQAAEELFLRRTEWEKRMRFKAEELRLEYLISRSAQKAGAAEKKD